MTRLPGRFRMSPGGWAPASAVAVVVAGGVLGGLIGLGVASVPGPSYSSTATAVFTAVQADGTGDLGSEAQYVQDRLPSWAAFVAGDEVLGQVRRQVGPLPGVTISALAPTGTEVLDVTVTGPDPAPLPAAATAAGNAAIDVVTSPEIPPDSTVSHVTGTLVSPGGPVVDERGQWQRWAEVLGAVFGLLLAWLACALIRPVRWARQLDALPPMPPAAGAGALADEVREQLWSWRRQWRTRKGLFVIGCAVFAVGGYAVTGSAVPPLIVVLIAGVAGLNNPRWPAAALLLLSLTVLPDKVELIPIGPITPTVNEVALVLAVLAVLPAHRADSRRSVFGPQLLLVLVAIAVGAALGMQRHGDFAQASDAVRALLLIAGYVVVRRAFARHLPQFLALLVLGAAVASTVEILAAVFDWQRLLVDEVTQVVTGSDTADVSRLAAPILPMWGPLLVLLVSGALPRRPRWLWAVLLVPGVVHVILSFNRSTWGPLLVCVVLVAGACYGVRGIVRRGLIIAVVGVVLLGSASIGVFGGTGQALALRFTSLATGSALDSDSLADRLGEDAAAMRTLRAEPLLGTGMGQPYGGTLISYDNLHGNTVVEARPWIHNQYLRIWLLMGALGLVAFGLVMVRVIAVVTRSWFRCVPGATLILATGLGLACIAAQAVLQTSLIDRPSVLTVSVLLAVISLATGWKPASPVSSASFVDGVHMAEAGQERMIVG